MDEPRLSTPTERALYRDCKRYKAERDRLHAFVKWVAGHKLIEGVYSDDEHPYDEWVTPDADEMDFGQIHEYAVEALSDLVIDHPDD